MSNKLRNTFKKVKGKRAIALGLILSLSSGLYTAYADELYEVSVVTNGDWEVFRTNEPTVGEFFEDEKIFIHPKDIINTELTTKTQDNMVVYVDAALKVNFVIDGKEQIPFITGQSKIGTALDEFEKETNKFYYLEDGQSSASEVQENMLIKVSTTKEEIKTIQQEIKFETIYEENPNLYIGLENIKVAGQNGAKDVVIKEIHKNDTLDSQIVLSQTITKEPIAQVIEKGTKQKNTIQTEKGTFIFEEKINMKSTAYTAGASSTGKNPGDAGYGITASGMKAQRGVVAVDTSVIPFGTELYIEGYGYAIAGDTGSAIKGNKVDVFMDSYNDAIQYGVKSVNVYVLGEKIS